jgi:N-methylhydantoinase B/oxoprolinase/acetone carboxylase alpha subunit
VACALPPPRQFLRPLTVGILSERRALPPFGLAGGREGARGVNLWLRADPTGTGGGDTWHTVSLGGKATVRMGAGDRLRLLTPGGGGYGTPPAAEEEDAAAQATPPLPASQQQPAVPAQRGASGSLAAYAAAQETV